MDAYPCLHGSAGSDWGVDVAGLVRQRDRLLVRRLATSLYFDRGALEPVLERWTQASPRAAPHLRRLHQVDAARLTGSSVRRASEQIGHEVDEGADLQRRVSRLRMQGIDGHRRQLVVRKDDFERTSGDVGGEAVLE